MRPFLAFALALALLQPAAAGAEGAAPPAENNPGQALGAAMKLRSTVERVQQIEAQIRAGDDAAADGLPREIDTLSLVIDEDRLSPGATALAYYYRGLARKLQAERHRELGGADDRAWARATLADFDAALGLGPEAAIAASAEYLAGGVAYNALHDNATAYGYWERCAALDHVACLGIVADAKLTGADGKPVDPPRALTLHRKIFDTGIAFNCAGAYSALAIAEITHFTQATPAPAEALAWMERADALLDALAARFNNNQSLCDRGAFELTEFLLRLSAGERRNGLLSAAGEHAGTPQTKAMAEYFSGAIDDGALAQALAKTDEPARCEAHFLALWYLELTKETARAEAQFRAMTALGESNCRSRLTFAHKLKGDG